MNAPKTPECNKLSALSAQRATLQDFFVFLEEKGYRICEIPATERYDRWMPIPTASDSLILAALGIDEKKLEQERRALLDSIATP